MSLQGRFLAVDAEMRLCAALFFYAFCDECVAVSRVGGWARVSMIGNSLDRKIDGRVNRKSRHRS